MLFVGLTGGLGSGKSEALAACERLGAATLSSDAVVHDLLGTEEVRDLLRERWGDRVIAGGEVDRAAVAAIVFEQPEELAWLEGELFPRVGDADGRVARRARAARSAARHRGGGGAAAVRGGDREGVFDATIAVVADEALREERAAARGTRASAGREGAQLTQEEKAARADYVVHNNGSLAELEGTVGEVLDQLRARVSG